ncbi:MAG: DNA polymerase III subunit gamma/tau [Clostridia bacterium]|nr:DNA polymerase III subunit gamma/tau [Clostridia bacterium]
MAYTALYRKFRPLKFSQMVGQGHITETLKKQIIAGRVGHAYLFNGGRGTGKTSSAKILARAVNCLNPQDGEPCNECEICKAILSGLLTDVVEMDAASNNSVENIRAIREEVNFLPTRAKYRIYIIDEVHMLSTGAFNALLKTLEEPPEHVKFILATTEPQKLPATILSRCQRFDFKRISNEDIVKRLKIICKESNIEITENALNIIAVLAEGAMRDAISILERCTGEDKGLIDEDYVRELVGIPKLAQIYQIVKAILDENTQEVISVTNSVINEGKDIDNFLWEIIKYIKDMLIYISTGSLELYNEQEKEQIKGLVENISKQKLLELIYNLSKLANEIKWSSQKTIMFQAGIISACIEEKKYAEVDTLGDLQKPSKQQNKNQALGKIVGSNLQEPRIQPIANNNIAGRYLR